jgi:hypothetical protein
MNKDNFIEERKRKEVGDGPGAQWYQWRFGGGGKEEDR